MPFLISGISLLDCGCASGSITVGLVKAIYPGQATGVDISHIEIERAAQRAAEENITNIRFEVGNVYELDFSDNSFDAIFSHNVLEHISEPKKVLREMHRVLKPRGVIGSEGSSMKRVLPKSRCPHPMRFILIVKIADPLCRMLPPG